MAGLSGPAFSQGFSSPCFDSPASLSFNGDAGLLGDSLRLTPSLASQLGSAWFDQQVFVGNGFETTFTFRISDIVNGGAVAWPS